MRETPESHSGPSPERADAYGGNVHSKPERCLRVTDAEYDAALRRLGTASAEPGRSPGWTARHAGPCLRRPARLRS
jgi:hypothetical protein